MCILAILFRVANDCPLIVAANREELYDRPATPPELWGGKPRFVAGRDLHAGGTWLGVNEFGVLVALTNRPKRMSIAAARSRGLLCRDLLACTTAAAAHDRALGELGAQPYAGCNILAGDCQQAWVIQAGDVVRSVALPPGAHVMTAHDANDFADARIEYGLDWLRSRSADSADAWLAALPELCRFHAAGDQPAICLHARDRGTVSGSIIALPIRPGVARWLHAQGPPCANAFADYSGLLAELFA